MCTPLPSLTRLWWHPLPQEIESSEDPNLRKAQRIVHNIRKRRLYRFADEYILPRGLAERLKKVGDGLLMVATLVAQSGHKGQP